jgi:hypothetical protein
MRQRLGAQAWLPPEVRLKCERLCFALDNFSGTLSASSFLL